MDKLVICIEWGTMYSPEYVNVMCGMVSRNLTGLFKFVCFTDDMLLDARVGKCQCTFEENVLRSTLNGTRHDMHHFHW